MCGSIYMETWVYGPQKPSNPSTKSHIAANTEVGRKMELLPHKQSIHHLNLDQLDDAAVLIIITVHDNYEVKSIM